MDNIAEYERTMSIIPDEIQRMLDKLTVIRKIETQCLDEITEIIKIDNKTDERKEKIKKILNVLSEHAVEKAAVTHWMSDSIEKSVNELQIAYNNACETMAENTSSSGEIENDEIGTSEEFYDESQTSDTTFIS